MGQSFAKNYNPLYASNGLLGHTGIDEGCGFGTPITAKYDALVYKVLSAQRPANDGSGYTGVFMIVDDGLECFEWHVGHCDPNVMEGGYISDTFIIGTEANHGDVYAGNIKITLAMQKAGDQRGAHRHYQKRPVMPVLRTSGSNSYLTAYGGSPFRSQAGFNYQVIAPYNGFNGCVSPLVPVFTRDLTIGSSGYDVFVLQRILARKGFLSVEPTGYFGFLTAAAVARFQSEHMRITPTSYFGPKSKSYALRELGPLPNLNGQ